MEMYYLFLFQYWYGFHSWTVDWIPDARSDPLTKMSDDYNVPTPSLPRHTHCTPPGIANGKTLNCHTLCGIYNCLICCSCFKISLECLCFSMSMDCWRACANWLCWPVTVWRGITWLCSDLLSHNLYSEDTELILKDIFSFCKSIAFLAARWVNMLLW